MITVEERVSTPIRSDESGAAFALPLENGLNDIDSVLMTVLRMRLRNPICHSSRVSTLRQYYIISL